MGQPVVLPKFELQGDRPHWAVRAAWITGGLLMAAVVALGGVIMHHRSLETQAQLARVEAIARVKAEADAKVAAIAAVAKAQKEAELAAKLAAQAIPATTVSPATAGETTSEPAAGAKTGAKSGHARRGHAVHAGGKGTKMASKSASKSGGKGEGKASNKPDAIDELLKKMK